MGLRLYRGEVMHRRLRPKRHRLQYRVFWLMFELDTLAGEARRFRLFSHNRFNLLAVHDRDHGDGSGRPLRSQVEAWLEKAGIEIGGGAIRLLTMPRVLGYGFNPISFYFCHAPDGRLLAMAYEVTSTFGIRHTYVVPVPEKDQQAGIIRQGSAKALYVSPFMGMEMDYAFRGRVPGERLDMAITGLDAEGPLIFAGMRGTGQPATDRTLLAALIAMPMLTLKVTAAIHWEALKLWLKGVRLTRQPAPAAEPFTLQSSATDSRL